MHRDTPPQTTSTLPEPAAARYVGMSRAYLRQRRQRECGPAYIRIGRAIRYRLTDLDAWLERHRVVTRESGR